MELKGKNIALFCISTFGYAERITKVYQKLGANIQYYDERPSDNLLAKSIIRVRSSLLGKRIAEYYSNILSNNSITTLDYLIVIRGEVVPRDFLEGVRALNPKCQLIFYTWDSMQNHSNALRILDLFDVKSTFDHWDAKELGMNLRPLFSTGGETPIINFESREYDLSFVGTVHSDRFSISCAVFDQFKKAGMKVFEYYYLQSKIVYYFKRIFVRDFGKMDLSRINTIPLDYNTYSSVMSNSKCVIDIHHPGQKGLTMRTFEALGSETKLITTNEHVSKYTIYNESNICIIDRKRPIVPIQFIESKFVNDSLLLHDVIGIDKWCVDILDEDYVSHWLVD